MLSLKILFSSIAIICVAGCSSNRQNQANAPITVIVSFGGDKQHKQDNVTWMDGITVLEALQHVALVETHPVGDYVFVTSIDSVKGKRGVMAWYYKVNGQSAKTLAIYNYLSPGDTVLWLYKTDVCSGSVDMALK